MKSLFFIIFLCACSHSAIKTVDILEGKTRDNYEATGKEYMISSQGAATTKAAKFAFDNGGNIYDAFVAASFAISVERPHSTGIGGGGFLVSYDASDAQTHVYDFRETAPLKASSNMYLGPKGEQIKERSLTGALAVGVPGLVAGLWDIHEKHGKLPFAKLIEPAYKLANDGMVIYPALAKAIEAKKDKLCLFESSARIFLSAGCKARKAGEMLYQKELAQTLRLIGKYGKDFFYKGPVAKKIVAYQKRMGGLISERDLKNYEVKKREPIVGSYKGYKVVSMPPSSSGGTHIVEILNILENYDLKKMGAQSAQAIHLTASAMQIAFADRAAYMGDSDFADVPIKKIIDKAYAKKISDKINLNHAQSSKDFPVPFKDLLYESDDTTHFTIMDKDGNTVTSTQTINGWFGSAMVTPGTGIVMNNEMDDFASHVGGTNLFGAVGGKNNLVEPGKRPLSSMSPTIIFKDDRPVLALGTPSGTRILTCVMQTALNVMEYNMPLWEAVSATRYHHQWSPDEIRVGAPYFKEQTMNKLKKMGYTINKKDLGCKVQAIMKENTTLLGVSDPREEGMSYGE